MNDYSIEELAPGLSESFLVRMTPQMMDAFRAITEDVNPLHIDPQVAIERGFADRVVYGMLHASFYSTLAGVYLPGRQALLQGVEVDFHHPVFVGDRLEVRGEVSYVQDALRHVEIKAGIHNQDGKAVSKARLKVGLHG